MGSCSRPVGFVQRPQSSKRQQNAIVSTQFLLTEEQAVAQGVAVSPFFHREAHVFVQVCVAVWLGDGGWRRKESSALGV